MKTAQLSRKTSALALLGAAGILFAPVLAPAASAQAPQGGFGGGQRGGGQRGGFQRPATGTVTSVDAAAGTITITSARGGNSQIIQTQGTTPLVSQSAASVSDLKVGDKIEVQGVPTAITASALTIGDSPLGGPGGGPGGPPPGGFGGPPPPGGPGGPPPPAMANATGTVTSTSPLTIALSSTASLTLKLDPNAKVTKFTPVQLTSIKVGDTVTGVGTANADGTFAATSVGVNLDPSAMGRGFGGGGFGGGGFGGGGGGFGGRGGGGRRGGGGPPPAPGQ
jgi:hypothetical protein